MVSPEILSELEEQLAAKAKLNAAEIREVLRTIRADAETVKTAPLAEQVCRDPDDDAILGAAISAKAVAIVSGDRDLIVLGRFQGIRILTPRDCLALLRSR